MNLESLKNKICIVKYKDASYSYIDLMKKKFLYQNRLSQSEKSAGLPTNCLISVLSGQN